METEEIKTVKEESDVEEINVEIDVEEEIDMDKDLYVLQLFDK